MPDTVMAPRAKNQTGALVEDALVELCFDRGLAATTVEALCERAGTEQADFEQRFEGLEDCFCQTLEALRDDFFAYLDRCLVGQERWVDRLRAIAYGLLRYLRADRARTHFLAVELHLAGERATLIWTETILGPLLDRIDEGRAEAAGSEVLSRGTAEAIGGSVFGRIHVAAAGGEDFEDNELVPQLMYLAVLPYLGEEAARAELSAPAPPDPGATRPTKRGYVSAVAEKGSGAQDMALELPDLGPLLGGHHGLSPEQVAESQRERLLAAVAGIVGEQGYRAATIAKIVKAASVSTRDFYDHFSSVEECFLAAFEAVVANLEALVANGVEAIPDWPDRVVAALRVALDFFTEEPQLARVCLIEPVSATPATALRFHEAVSQCVPLLSQGRALHSGGGSLPRSTEDSLLGGAVSIVTRSMLGGAVLSELLPDLVEFMLSPYVGAERAKQLAASSGSF